MPVLHLTKATLQTLPLPTTTPQAYYYDTELPNFGVVVGRTGSKTFIARGWVKGRNVRVKIGVAGAPRADGAAWTVALARAAAKQLIGQMADGHDPNARAASATLPAVEATAPVRTEPSTAAGGRAPTAGPMLSSPDASRVTVPTFRDAMTAHVDKMRKKKRSARSIETLEGEIGKYLAAWLDRPLAELTGAVLVDLHDSIKRNARARAGANPNNERGAPMANRVIAHVSACWNTLNRRMQGALGGWNPAASVERDRLMPKRQRIDDATLPDWYQRVQTMRNSIQRDGLVFALFTGLRSEDVRTARHEHVNGRTLTLPDPKGGEARAFKIPLGDTAYEIVMRRRVENAALPLFPEGDGGYIFPGLDQKGRPGAIADLRQQVHDGKRHARFPAEDVHTLRRTYESVAHETGISDLDLHVLTNHSFASHNVNATYIAQAMPHLALCQAKIDEALQARLKGTATNGSEASATQAA